MRDIRVLLDGFEMFLGSAPPSIVGHVVLSDYNLSDAHIDFQLQYANAHREEILRNHAEITPAEFDIVRAFLVFLKTVPEDLRWEWTADDE